MGQLSRCFRYLFSSEDGVGNHLVARWIFLRSLGLIYFAAFFALLFQIRGLVDRRVFYRRLNIFVRCSG